ncbi:MAG: hypothetical protein ACHQJ7_11230, partial [Vicinamibacteria bacterium]
MPNPLKRQWFRPGAGVERIAKLPTSRFLLRRTPDASHASSRCKGNRPRRFPASRRRALADAVARENRAAPPSRASAA